MTTSVCSRCSEVFQLDWKSAGVCPACVRQDIEHERIKKLDRDRRRDEQVREERLRDEASRKERQLQFQQERSRLVAELQWAEESEKREGQERERVRVTANRSLDQAGTYIAAGMWEDALRSVLAYQEVYPKRLDGYETLVEIAIGANRRDLLLGAFKGYAARVRSMLSGGDQLLFDAEYRSALESKIKLIANHGVQGANELAQEIAEFKGHDRVSEEHDPVFHEAIRIVRTLKNVEVLDLQQKLGIRYSRAWDICQRLAHEGHLIEDPNGKFRSANYEPVVAMQSQTSVRESTRKSSLWKFLAGIAIIGVMFLFTQHYSR
ncbi:hypothetical protein [Paraburkholderia sp. SIMBA_054]|uniref:hypothetical protein n=1 Tax=Paraburkholderia sp. SIMBA_054 TaxID=3085795 RepID=UPI00397E1C30